MLTKPPAAPLGTSKYDAIKRCQPLVWGNMTHDDASVETGVGGQAKYDMMMVFCGNALQKHNKTLKSSTRRYPDCYILHILNRYNKYNEYFCISLSLFLNKVNNRVNRSALQTKIRSTQYMNGFEVLVQV